MRFIGTTILSMICSGQLFGFQPSIADFNSYSPNPSGFSHPRISPHERKQSGLRNLNSRATAIEELMLTGTSMESCSIQNKKKWLGISDIKHQRFNIICHGLPVYGAFLSSHGSEKKNRLFQGSIPEKDVYFISGEALLSRQEVRDQMISHANVSDGNLYYYLNPETYALTPSYIFRVSREDLTVWDYVFDARSGEMLAQIAKFFHISEGYSFLENPIESELLKVQLSELIEDSIFLDGNHFNVFGADENSDRAQSFESFFDYLPETPLLFDQVQTYFSLERARNFFDQYFDLSQDQAITVYTHTFLENNAMYVPGEENLPPAIFIGEPDGVFMQNLNRDSDVLIHEYSHHIIYEFLTSTWGESLTLHEGTADFFAYVINNDPFLAESILIGDNYLRSADIDASRKHDIEAEYKGSHLLGQFWSALLWRLFQNLDSSSLKMITNSLNYWPENAKLKDAINALLLSDQDVYGGANHCQILEQAMDLGFYNALREFNLANCNLSNNDIIPLSIEQKKNKRANVLSCGAIGLQKSAYSCLLLLAPCLMLIGRKIRET